MAETELLAVPFSVAAEKAHKPLAVFDATLIAAAAALLVAAVMVHGNESRLVTGLAAAGTATVAVTVALTLSRRSRGVFLTPTLRVVLLIAAAGSLGLLAGTRPVIAPRPPTPDTSSAAAMFNLQVEKAALEGQIAAKTEEAKYLRAALDKSGADRDDALRRANEQLIETERLREQERQRQEKQSAKDQVQPPATPTAEPQTEKQRLARAWNIPEVQVESQRQIFEQHPFGRNVIEAILGKAPLIGQALGSLFGGGSTRSVTVRVVEKLQGGTIPAAADLLGMFLASDNPANLTSDLFVLIDRGEARGVISKEDAAAMKGEIDRIRNAAAAPVSSDAEKARDVIAKALAAGKACSIALTSPNFVTFASTAEKRKLIATTTDAATKSCLEQYPAAGSTPAQ